MGASVGEADGAAGVIVKCSLPGVTPWEDSILQVSVDANSQFSPAFGAPERNGGQNPVLLQTECHSQFLVVFVLLPVDHPDS